MAPEPVEFADVLRRHRTAAGLTQEELAEHAGLSPRGVHYLEHSGRQPYRDTVRRLADALGLEGEERVQFEVASRSGARPPASTANAGRANAANAQAGTTRPDEAEPAGEAHPVTNLPRSRAAQLGREQGFAETVALLPTLPTGMLTFLIADVRGYTAFTHARGDEAGARLATQFAAIAEMAIARGKGRLVEVRGDEVMAVFTSARSALRAAVDLLVSCAEAATRDVPLQAGVGLDVGEPTAVPGGYRGEAVNVAARLCAQAGPGEVLASDAVVHLARRIEGLTYQERGPLALKGISRPIRAWLILPEIEGIEPVDASPLPLVTQPQRVAHGGYLGALPLGLLVSREAERARIIQVITAAAGGQGHLLLLAGEPGVGKTRLAQEAMIEARAAGLRVLLGRCYEEQCSTPYVPFIEALTGAWAAASPALLQMASVRFAELGRLLPDLLTAPPLPEGEDLRLRVLRAVTGFLHQLAQEGPLALLLDDLHWADSASLELLAHMTRALRGDPVLVLGTYRDVEVGRQHPLESMLTMLTRDRVVELVTLRGLSPNGTADLIRARFGLADVSAELRDLVHERTEGNPFFTEEVLSALVEQGAIFRAGEGWDRKMLAEIVVPQSIRSVVGQRVGRLAPEAQEVLRLASVLGQEFELPLLLEAAEQGEAAVLDHLEAALNARLLEERPAGRGERYAFAHALIAQTLYDEVPRFRLRRLHLRAGGALERLGGGATAAELARHFLAGGDDARGARYSLAAGDHAASLLAHGEALQHYETALALVEEARDEAAAADVRAKLGTVLFQCNRVGEALTTLATALTIYERRGDAVGQARVHREIAWIHSVGAREEVTAASHLGQALALWPPEREDAELARLLIDAGRARALVGDAEAAGPLAARGMALAEQLGDDALRTQALLALSFLQGVQGGPAQIRVDLMNRAELLAERAGDRHTLGRVYRNRSLYKSELGELGEGRVDARRAVEVVEQADLLGQVASHCRVLAGACYELGAWQEARAALRKARSHVPGSTDSLLAWLEGDFAGSIQLGHAEVAGSRRKGDIQSLVGGLWALGDSYLQLDRLQEAETAVREAAAAVRQHGYVWFMGVVYATQAEIAVRAETTDVEAILAEAERTLDRSPRFLGRLTLLRAKGTHLANTGDLPGAVAILQAGADTARTHGALVDLARMLAHLAEMAPAAGNVELAASAEAERAAIVAQIGPEVRGLTWARGLP